MPPNEQVRPVLDAAEQLLDSNADLRGLARALRLGEGFQLLVLVAETPAVAEVGIQALELGMSTDKGRSIRAARFAPAPKAGSQALAPAAPLPEAFGSWVTGVQALPENQRAELVIIDASRSSPEDAGTWEVLFHRLNQLRNGWARLLPVPLLLVLPPRYDAYFASIAPDFWSVRSAVARLAANVLPGSGARYWGEAPLPLFGSEAWGNLSRDADRLRHQGDLHHARLAAEQLLRVAGYPGTESSSTQNPDWEGVTHGLLHLGDIERDRGNLTEAGQRYDEALRCLGSIESTPPGRLLAAEVHRRRALARLLAGDVDGSVGETAATLALATQLVNDFPTMPVMIRELADVHALAAAASMMTGEPSVAVGYLSNELRLRKQLVEWRTDASRDAPALAKAWLHLGAIHEQRGEPEGAKQAYQAALQQLQGLAKDAPGGEVADLLARAAHGLGREVE